MDMLNVSYNFLVTADMIYIFLEHASSQTLHNMGIFEHMNRV